MTTTITYEILFPDGRVDPTEPTAAPDDGRGYHWTRAALEQYEMTRGRSAHADATADYMIREAYYRDTRAGGRTRREIAHVPINDIRAYVAADDLASGYARTVRFVELPPARLEVYPVDAGSGARPLEGEARTRALEHLRVIGEQPPGVRVCYLGVPVTRGEVDWRA